VSESSTNDLFKKNDFFLSFKKIELNFVIITNVVAIQ